MARRVRVADCVEEAAATLCQVSKAASGYLQMGLEAYLGLHVSEVR